MRKLLVLGAAALMMSGMSIAAEFKSGLQPGDSVGPFEVEKCAGAVNDGKNVGDNFCYRCMLGNRPVVMVFARKADDRLAMLVKELDKSVAKHSDKKLASFVNMIGTECDCLKTAAKEFADKNEIKNVALVVPHDSENGPKEFKINPEAEVTVMIYREGKVASNHSFSAGQLDEKAVQSILGDTAKLLN